MGGGPEGYVENALKAVAEPFHGITADGRLVPGLFPIQKTGVPTDSIRKAAEEFLASLNLEQRTNTLFPVDAVEWRKWSNIHRTLMRHGMPLFEMTDSQRDRAFALLKESLSAQGFATARDVMRLNETVMEMTGRLDEYGEDLYWLSIMGRPSAAEPWGWQIDGHHLNINTFVFGDQVVMTPTFLGSEPVYAKSGIYAGTRAFKAEEEQGLALMRFLQSNAARLSSPAICRVSHLPQPFAIILNSATRGFGTTRSQVLNVTFCSAWLRCTSAASGQITLR